MFKEEFVKLHIKFTNCDQTKMTRISFHLRKFQQLFFSRFNSAHFCCYWNIKCSWFFCYPNVLTTCYFRKQRNNAVKSNFEPENTSKEPWNMIIEEMKKNSLIHLHVIPLWCICWHGMQQNGHFLQPYLFLKHLGVVNRVQTWIAWQKNQTFPIQLWEELFMFNFFVNR